MSPPFSACFDFGLSSVDSLPVALSIACAGAVSAVTNASVMGASTYTGGVPDIAAKRVVEFALLKYSSWSTTNFCSFSDNGTCWPSIIVCESSQSEHATHERKNPQPKSVHWMQIFISTYFNFQIDMEEGL